MTWVLVLSSKLYISYLQRVVFMLIESLVFLLKVKSTYSKCKTSPLQERNNIPRYVVRLGVLYNTKMSWIRLIFSKHLVFDRWLSISSIVDQKNWRLGLGRAGSAVSGAGYTRLREVCTRNCQLCPVSNFVGLKCMK